MKRLICFITGLLLTSCADEELPIEGRYIGFYTCEIYKRTDIPPGQLYFVSEDTIVSDTNEICWLNLTPSGTISTGSVFDEYDMAPYTVELEDYCKCKVFSNHERNRYLSQDIRRDSILTVRYNSTFSRIEATKMFEIYKRGPSYLPIDTIIRYHYEYQFYLDTSFVYKKPHQN
jgi:hypothetical protein